MKQLIIKVINHGKVMQAIDLSNQSFQIKATQHTDYLVADKATGHAPTHLTVKRSGNDLIIHGDDESQYLVVQDYYSTDKVALIGENNGQLYAYNAFEADASTEVASLGTDAITPVHTAWWEGNSTLATVGLIGLGVAGIAAAADGNDSDSHDKHTHSNPTPTIPTTDNNHAPTAIVLKGNSVTENATGATIGTLTTTDPDANNTFTYSVNDDRFEVVNGTLKLKDGVALDYEATPTVSVEVTSTDQGGLATKQTFNVTVLDINENPTPITPPVTPPPVTPTNHAPTAIALDNTNVTENATGATIGTLTTTDPDANNTFTYSVNDDRFEVVNGTLKLKDGIAVDYEATPSIPVTVTSTDQGGLATQQSFTIVVTDVNENHAPTDISLDNNSVTETMAGVVIGTLSTTDPDANNTFTYSVNDDRFEVVNGQLKLKDGIVLNYEDTPSITVTVTSTDQGGLATNKQFNIVVNDIDETDYIYGDALDNTINGTPNDDVIIGSKGNDTLNGGTGVDYYVFYKGDGKDVINEENLYNAIEFNDVNSQDITVERYQENITIHYGNNDSVTFNVNAIQQINFKDTKWTGDIIAEKLGVPYWNQDLSYTLVDDNFSTDKDHNKVIYFSFPTTNLQPDDTSITGWAPFTEEQKALARQTFHDLEALTPLTFVEVTANTLQSDVIYLQNNTQFEPGTLGLGGPNNMGGGDVWLGSTDISDLMRYTVAHEIGHVLGLDHPVDYENDPNKIYQLNDVEDNDMWTIMTYNRLITPTTYQEMDIATLQYLYGVNPNARTGDDSYTFDSTVGKFVWDGAGNDAIDASTATQSAYIDLHDGMWSYIGTKSDYISDPNQLTINSSTKIENAIGGSANDTLIGNELSNHLQGNAGDDTLTGYQGTDTIVFKSLTMDNTGGNGHDTYTDFHVGNSPNDNQADKIDLSQLLVGYTGDHSASSLASYITVNQQNGNTVISIDRDGTGTAYTTAELITLNNTVTTLDQLVTNGQLVI